MSTERECTNQPNINEIIFKINRRLDYLFSKGTGNLSKEQQEDVRQNAILWFLENYSRIDSSKGWTRFINEKCWGLIFDFLRDKKQTFINFSEGNPKRVFNTSSEGSVCDVNKVLNRNELDPRYEVQEYRTEEQIYNSEVKWELLKRMASEDKELKAFLMQVFNRKLSDIGKINMVSASRAEQIVSQFISRFEEKKIEQENQTQPEDQMNFLDSDSYERVTAMIMWNRQIAWAMRISERLGWPDEPQVYPGTNIMVGAQLKPINLNEEAPERISQPVQSEILEN